MKVKLHNTQMIAEMYLNCAVRLKAGEKIDLMPGMNENELNSYIADGMITPLDSYVEKMEKC